MRIFTTLLAALLICGLAGCTSSVHPIFTEADLSHDVDLSGTWQQLIDDPDKGSYPNFQCEGFDKHSSYDLKFLASPTEKNRPNEKFPTGIKYPLEYDLKLGRVDGERYLQLSRVEFNTGGPAFFEGAVTYAWAKFKLEDDILHVYPIDDQAMAKLLPKTEVSHIMRTPDVARFIEITESTKGLQNFLKSHHREIFDALPLKFKRLQTGGK